MKKLFFLFFILHSSLFICNAQEVINLEKGWSLQSSAGGEVYPATVPSTVMGVLTANGLYGDLLEATNYKKADRAPFDVSWVYSTNFDLKDLAGKSVFLAFDGITYRANVWLNGRLVASKDELFGAFCRWEFDVTQFAQEKNELKVEVFRARSGEPNIGFVDWNPRPLDENMGIFRPVTVRVTDGVRLKNSWVKTDVNTRTLDEAILTVETYLENHSGESVTGTVHGHIGKVQFEREVTLAAGEKQRVAFTEKDVPALRFQNPRLWWSVGMGEPNLYELEMSFTVGEKRKKKTVDSERVKFGIREIETYFTDAGHKGYMLNGKKVLIKGAGWTDDIFLRDTHKTNEHQVKMVRDMGLNTIRFENIWGTDHNIYDLCDRYGILAMVGWSCQWEWEGYLGTPEDDFMSIRTPEDIALVTRYFRDQVLWLRNHPAIIAWYGGSDKLARPELERNYLEILKELDTRPYVGSAKIMTSEVTGPSGMKMYGPYEYVGPNYWWIDTRLGGAYGFNTETGPGAQLPVLESIKKFVPADELWPMGPSWDYHCTTSTTDMNSMRIMNDVIDKKYGGATTLNEYLRKADLAAYESTKSMFEAFRTNKYEATGVIQWMLNSAWPSMYWQLYDYYGVPTASYYAVKKANAPHQLVYSYKDRGIYIVNELPTDAAGFTAVVRTFGADSKPILSQELTIASRANSSERIAEIDPGASFVALQLFDRSGAQVAENFYALSETEDVYNWESSEWVHTPMKTYADFGWLNGLERAQLEITPVVKGGKLTLTIENGSDVIAFFTSLKLLTVDGDVAHGAFWGDNYLNILPGQTRVVTCEGVSAAGLTLQIDGWNVGEMRLEL